MLYLIGSSKKQQNDKTRAKQCSTSQSLYINSGIARSLKGKRLKYTYVVKFFKDLKVDLLHS